MYTYVQCSLNYLHLKHLIIQIVEMTALLDYFV